MLGYSLKSQRLNKPVVLGIPRGGLVVAREVARMLDGDLDIVLARKLDPIRRELTKELQDGAQSYTASRESRAQGPTVRNRDGRPPSSGAVLETLRSRRPVRMAARVHGTTRATTSAER